MAPRSTLRSSRRCCNDGGPACKKAARCAARTSCMRTVMSGTAFMPSTPRPRLRDHSAFEHFGDNGCRDLVEEFCACPWVVVQKLNGALFHVRRRLTLTLRLFLLELVATRRLILLDDLFCDRIHDGIVCPCG